jgi:hypothetical protein
MATEKFLHFKIQLHFSKISPSVISFLAKVAFDVFVLQLGGEKAETIPMS